MVRLSISRMWRVVLCCVFIAMVCSAETAFVIHDHGAVRSQSGTLSVSGSIGGILIPIDGVASDFVTTSGTPVTVIPGIMVVIDRSVGSPPAINSLIQLSVNEDQSIEFAVQAVDPDTGDALALFFATPTNGSVVALGAGRARYTPNANYHGTDQCTVSASNLLGESVSGTIRIAIASVADPPLNTRRPVISGHIHSGQAVIGQVLTVTPGTWNDDADGNPSSAIVTGLRWQRWQRGAWVDLIGESGLTYVVTATDRGTQVRVLETATDSDPSTNTAASDGVPIPGAKDSLADNGESRCGLGTVFGLIMASLMLALRSSGMARRMLPCLIAGMLALGTASAASDSDLLMAGWDVRADFMMLPTVDQLNDREVSGARTQPGVQLSLVHRSHQISYDVGLFHFSHGSGPVVGSNSGEERDTTLAMAGLRMGAGWYTTPWIGGRIDLGMHGGVGATRLVFTHQRTAHAPLGFGGTVSADGRVAQRFGSWEASANVGWMAFAGDVGAETTAGREHWSFAGNGLFYGLGIAYHL